MQSGMDSNAIVDEPVDAGVHLGLQRLGQYPLGTPDEMPRWTGRWTAMTMAAGDDAHEFVVAPELAEVAERLCVPLHAGDRVRFVVIEGGFADGGAPTRHEPWPPA